MGVCAQTMVLTTRKEMEMGQTLEESPKEKNTNEWGKGGVQVGSDPVQTLSIRTLNPILFISRPTLSFPSTIFLLIPSLSLWLQPPLFVHPRRPIDSFYLNTPFLILLAWFTSTKTENSPKTKQCQLNPIWKPP